MCPGWVFGLFSAFRGVGSALPGGSAAPIGAVGPHNAGESLKTFHASFGVDFQIFWRSLFGFYFSIPARLGGHEAKGTKWPLSAILCHRRHSGDSGPLLPQLQEAENPLGDSGS